MSVTVRPYRRGGWEVDIRLVLPDDTEHRERRKAPVSTKSAAQRWGEAREREWFHQLTHPEAKQTAKEVPTLATFAPRFLEGYAVANHQKPSGVASKETILRVHLIPELGTKRLNDIRTEDVQQLKLRLRDYAPKTTNNVLTVLNMLLKKAVEWEELDRLPCTVKLLPITRTPASFHDFEAYERLIEAAQAIGWRTYLIVLLGGEAGLRSGEIVGLHWVDVNFDNRQLCIRRSDWNGHITSPKSGRVRYVPMTERLVVALREHQHLRGPRVVCKDDGRPLTRQSAYGRVMRAARRAKVSPGVHILRHTFCSHLAMRGAAGRAIQELAGHRDLAMTQHYMHLSPAALDTAIRLLESPRVDLRRGDIMETGDTSECKVQS